jgi:hypothetical protein
VDSSYVSRRVEKITYDDQRAILQEVAALDENCPDFCPRRTPLLY